MAEGTSLQSEHDSSMRHWQRTAPWLRRFSMRIGLEGKLVLCFMAVLCASMSLTCVIFIREAHARLTDIMGEQARQVATALSLTSERLYRNGDWGELHRRGQELVKSRNILFVGYLDSNAASKALASRDIDFKLDALSINARSLMQVTPRKSPTFGEYLEVVVPILSLPTPASNLSSEDRGSRLLGYVAVGVSQSREDVQIYRVYYLVIGIACILVMGAIPAAFIIVHRIFLPIRKLVGVTRQISSGDLDARVEIHRPDVIGDLARAFDEMVTWVKKQQDDLAEANRSLEEKVELRTAQLETANGRLSSEIAEKEEFLRAVSHDLNAPLRNIAGMATMLLNKHRGQFDADVVYRLERIKTNVDVETNLIGELLELSRIKTRRQKIEPVDLGVLVSELREMFENDLREKSIGLIVDSPLPILYAERARMRQVFQNLIDNAIKYMGDTATREIHIGCQEHRTEAEFYVRDTGIGIDPQDADKIFFVFRRGRNPAARNIAGKGIGLASVKSIIETYNGKIWVSSAPGKGSTFRFTINGKYQQPQPENSQRESADDRAAA